MDAMRADMGGAACVMASIYTAARLKLPINIKGTAFTTLSLKNVFLILETIFELLFITNRIFGLH